MSSYMLINQRRSKSLLLKNLYKSLKITATDRTFIGENNATLSYQLFSLHLQATNNLQISYRVPLFLLTIFNKF